VCCPVQRECFDRSSLGSTPQHPLSTSASGRQCLTERPTSRRCHSPVRRANAQETERRIIDAAATLFADHGYVATSLSAVADRAEVDPRTVYKVFGGKVGLLSRLVDVAIVGDQDPVPVADRSWAADAFGADTGEERVHSFAVVVRHVMASAGFDVVDRASPALSTGFS
jgi:AcrR family transcriptional regulator